MIEFCEIKYTQATQDFWSLHPFPIYQAMATSGFQGATPNEIPLNAINPFYCPLGECKDSHMIEHYRRQN
jgi:hypothetical protein